MQTKKTTQADVEGSLELKYCERCGGLWLRPAGGEQIYCAACFQQMAELPPSSIEIESSRISCRRRRNAGHEGNGHEGSSVELDAFGGVA